MRSIYGVLWVYSLVLSYSVIDLSIWEQQIIRVTYLDMKIELCEDYLDLKT